MTNENAVKIVGTSRVLSLNLSYSGRGMFGTRTAAVCGPKKNILAQLKKAGLKKADVSFDSMGKNDVVAY